MDRLGSSKQRIVGARHLVLARLDYDDFAGDCCSSMEVGRPMKTLKAGGGMCDLPQKLHEPPGPVTAKSFDSIQQDFHLPPGRVRAFGQGAIEMAGLFEAATPPCGEGQGIPAGDKPTDGNGYVADSTQQKL